MLWKGSPGGGGSPVPLPVPLCVCSAFEICTQHWGAPLSQGRHVPYPQRSRSETRKAGGRAGRGRGWRHGWGAPPPVTRRPSGAILAGRGRGHRSVPAPAGRRARWAAEARQGQGGEVHYRVGDRSGLEPRGSADGSEPLGTHPPLLPILNSALSAPPDCVGAPF